MDSTSRWWFSLGPLQQLLPRGHSVLTLWCWLRRSTISYWGYTCWVLRLLCTGEDQALGMWENKQCSCLAWKKKTCHRWNQGRDFMSDWLDKSLISKDSLVISRVAPLSVLPYSREIPVTSLRCVYCVLNTEWHKHTHWHTHSRLHGICFICEIQYRC